VGVFSRSGYILYTRRRCSAARLHELLLDSEKTQQNFLVPDEYSIGTQGWGEKEEREKGTQKEEDDWDLFFLILGEDIEALSFLFSK
jgi:hypothetical protein